MEDEVTLRQVFFGEGESPKNYAVLCHEEDSKVPISSVFQEAASDGSAPAEFRLLDCNHILTSSEKTISERFKLNLKNRPVIFVSGQVGEPKQVRDLSFRDRCLCYLSIYKSIIVLISDSVSDSDSRIMVDAVLL